MKQKEKALKAIRRTRLVGNPADRSADLATQNLAKELLELKQAYESLRQQVESSDIGTWDWDLLSGRIKWSSQMEKLCGLPPGAFGGTIEAFIELVYLEDRPTMQAILKNAFETGEFREAEYRVKLPTGNLHYLLCKGRFIKDNAGKPLRLVGTVLDITDRKEAEVALHFLAEASELLASSLDYQTTLQNLAQLIVPKLSNWCSVHIVDATGYPKQVALAHANPAKIEWATRVQAELESRYPYDPDYPAGIPQVIRTGQPELYPNITDEILIAAAQDERQLEILREIQYTSLMIVPLMARGRVIGVIQFVATQESNYHYNEQDLSLTQEIARRAAIAVDNARLYQDSQQALAAQQELDQLRDRFLSIASHELRTPLTAIKGFSQLLHLAVGKRQKLLEAPNEATEFNLAMVAGWLSRDGKMLESIQHQVNRMNELIGEMLDISRIQSGHLRLVFTPNLNIFEIIQRSIDQQQTVSPHHHILLETPPDVTRLEQWRTEGCWDERRVEQVLSNLLNNAVKYSPPQTTIRVGLEYRPQQAKLDRRGYGQPAPAQAEYIIISVKDEGYGVNPEDQANIFQRFYRVGSEAGRNLDGLGLGLYISNQIVIQHGGQMWVESKPGKGSTFYFSLPLKSAKND